MKIKVEKFYDKNAKIYDSILEEPFWRLYHDITWNSIKKFLPKKKKATILDAGGGTGYWAIPLAKLGYKVVITDISEEMLKVAKRKAQKEKLDDRIEIKKVDIRDMSCFEDNSFYLVLAQGDVVSYCLDAEKAIKELARVAKKGAPIIVSVDNKYSFLMQLISTGNIKKAKKLLKTGRILFPPFEKEQFEIQLFTPGELKRLFEKNKIKVVRIIGKPVLLQGFDLKKMNKLLSDEKIYKEVLKLELKFCDEESLIRLGGHLEIVGIKQ